MRTGLKRSGNEKFYTKTEVVIECLNTLNLSSYSTVIEPSAGNGSFSNLIPNCIAYDILPDCDGIHNQDYLTLDTTSLTNTIVIGNPPFGRNSSLAKKFIKKSCTYADAIAFILPKSFKKESMQSAFDGTFHLVKSMDLPQKSFEIEGESYDVPCVFQLWERRSTLRKVTVSEIPKNYRFTKNKSEANLAFQRVGGKAGLFKTDFSTASEQSHYFMIMEKIPDNLDIKWESNNTTGPKSISKKELIHALNKIT